VFVILSDVLELLIADGTIKRTKDFRYFSLESGATGNISLWYTTMGTSHVRKCVNHSLLWPFAVPLFRCSDAQSPTRVAGRP
jgi:hypothetical protein